MSDYFWLREAQFERIKPYFPLSHGVPRVDDRRVVSGIIHVIRKRLAMAGCSGGLWAAQDLIQQVRALVPHGCVCPYFPELGCR